MGETTPAVAPVAPIVASRRRVVLAAPVAAALDGLRVLALAGIPVGVVVAGLGGRLAMLVLRLTSSDRVDGVESDDGFTIGQFSLSGTYNLMLIGAVVGVIGAAAYQWVRPSLIGSMWMRRSTVALASGAVVGAMLVHADGIDFRVLTPTWLAIGLFVALPALFGLAIAIAVDVIERRQHTPGSNATRWVLPIVLASLFPLTLIALAVAAAVLLIWHLVRSQFGDRWRIAPPMRWALRCGWLAIAAIGLAMLIVDIRDIAAVT